MSRPYSPRCAYHTTNSVLSRYRWHVFHRKLRSLKQQGVDIDALPGDLTVAYVTSMSLEEAYRFTQTTHDNT